MAHFLDARAFRRFVNTVGVITVSHAGRDNAMSAEWCTPVSIEPRLIGVFVGYTRYTWTLVEESPVFGLSLLADHQAALSHDLGDVSGAEQDKAPLWAAWREAGQVLAVSLIREAQAQYECEKVSVHAYGDHALVVGRPVAARIDEDRSPLLYQGGRYHHLGPQVVKGDRL